MKKKNTADLYLSLGSDFCIIATEFYVIDSDFLRNNYSLDSVSFYAFFVPFVPPQCILCNSKSETPAFQKS
jgi:hypothetical protein